jgi:hypothetical protein
MHSYNGTQEYDQSSLADKQDMNHEKALNVQVM